MSDTSSSLLHLPSDVCAYLLALRSALLSALGEGEVMQIFVIGSASYPGGYIPHQSDIDIAVVTRSVLDPSSLAPVVQRCSHASLPCPAAKLELVVYAYPSVHPTIPTPEPILPYDISLNLNTGRTLAGDHVRFGSSADDSPHWFVLDIAAAHARHIPLLPDRAPASASAFGEVFRPPPSRTQVLDALQTSMAWHRAHEPGSANAVLNACRGWRWVRQGVWGSKAEGGQYALSRQPGQEVEGVVRRAMAQRAGEAVEAKDEGMGEVQKLYDLIAAELQSARNERTEA